MEVCYTEDYNCMGLIWTMRCQLELGFSYYYLVGRKDRFLLQMKGDKGNWLWLYSRVVNKLKMSANIIHEACSSLLLNKKTTQFLSPNHQLSPSLYFFDEQPTLLLEQSLYIYWIPSFYEHIVQVSWQKKTILGSSIAACSLVWKKKQIKWAFLFFHLQLFWDFFSSHSSLCLSILSLQLPLLGTTNLMYVLHVISFGT